MDHQLAMTPSKPTATWRITAELWAAVEYAREIEVIVTCAANARMGQRTSAGIVFAMYSAFEVREVRAERMDDER